jgi:hypothetical protein
MEIFRFRKKRFPSSQLLSVKALQKRVKVKDPLLSPHQQPLARLLRRHTFKQQFWTLCQPHVQPGIPTDPLKV